MNAVRGSNPCADIFLFFPLLFFFPFPFSSLFLSPFPPPSSLLIRTRVLIFLVFVVVGFVVGLGFVVWFGVWFGVVWGFGGGGACVCCVCVGREWLRGGRCAWSSGWLVRSRKVLLEPVACAVIIVRIFFRHDHWVSSERTEEGTGLPLSRACVASPSSHRVVRGLLLAGTCILDVPSIWGGEPSALLLSSPLRSLPSSSLPSLLSSRIVIRSTFTHMSRTLTPRALGVCSPSSFGDSDAAF